MPNHGNNDATRKHKSFEPGAVYEVTILLNGVLMRSTPMQGERARQMISQHSVHFPHMVMNVMEVDAARERLEHDIDTCQDTALQIRAISALAPSDFKSNEQTYWDAANRFKTWLDELP